MKCLLRIHGLERLPNVQKQKNARAKRAKLLLSLLKRETCEVILVVVETEAPWHQLQRNERNSLPYAAKDIIASALYDWNVINCPFLLSSYFSSYI